MTALFPVGSKVTVSSGEHTGKTGRVRGWTDLAKADVIHVIDLDEPFFVPDETPNPPEYGPGGPTGRKIHGESRPDQKVDWIEAPASCLS